MDNDDVEMEMEQDPGAEVVLDEAHLYRRFADDINRRNLMLEEKKAEESELALAAADVPRPPSLVNLVLQAIVRNIDVFMKQTDPFGELPTTLVDKIFYSLPRYHQTPPYLRMFVTKKSPVLEINLRGYCRAVPWTKDDLEEMCTLFTLDCEVTKILKIKNPVRLREHQPGFSCYLIRSLLPYLPKLEKLKLYDCRLDDSFLKALGKFCPNLKKVVSRFSDEPDDCRVTGVGFRSLVTNLPKLKHIELPTKDFKEEDVAFALKTLKSLDHLEYGGVDFTGQVSTAILSRVVKHYQSNKPVKLTTSLCYCENISKETIQRFLKIFPDSEGELEICDDGNDLSPLADCSGFTRIWMDDLDCLQRGQSALMNTIVMNSASTLTSLTLSSKKSDLVVNLGLVCKMCPKLDSLCIRVKFCCDEDMDFSDFNSDIEDILLSPPQLTSLPDELLFRLLFNTTGSKNFILNNVLVPDHVMERALAAAKQKNKFFHFAMLGLTHISPGALVSLLCRCECVSFLKLPSLSGAQAAELKNLIDNKFPDISVVTAG